MKIVFFGTPQEVVPVLEKLNKYHTVVSVITAPDQKSGRKQLLTPSPIKAFAQSHDLRVLQPEKLKDFSLQQIDGPIDLAIVAAYGKIIPNEILNFPKYGSINIHPSLLPKYRGPTPIQTTLLNGDKETGISFLKMDAEMDHGPLLKTISYPIGQTDTFQSLMQSMFQKAAEALPAVIDEYVSGNLKPIAQEHAKATSTKMISKEDGFIDLKNPPAKEQLHNMIHAYYPWPTAWTILHFSDSKGQAKEGRVKFLPDQQIQMEGKNPVSLQDFLNGYPELREKIAKLFA